MIAYILIDFLSPFLCFSNEIPQIATNSMNSWIAAFFSAAEPIRYWWVTMPTASSTTMHLSLSLARSLACTHTVLVVEEHIARTYVHIHAHARTMPIDIASSQETNQIESNWIEWNCRRWCCWQHCRQTRAIFYIWQCCPRSLLFEYSSHLSNSKANFQHFLRLNWEISWKWWD